MKYKYPTKLKIGDVIFNIKYNHRDDAASFCYPDGDDAAYIEFGLRSHEKHPELFLNLIIHELKEIIQIEQATRYDNNNRSYIFHYTHVEHTDLCRRLSGLLLEFIE